MSSQSDVALGVGLVVGAFAGGVAVGYFSTKKRLELKYKQLAEDEILEMREHFRNAKPIVATKPGLDDLVEDLGYHEGYTPEEQAAIDEIIAQENAEVEESISKNVFDTAAEAADVYEWDYAKENRSRRHDMPYAITREEFFENEGDFSTTTYTYYEGDDILADERNNVIDDQDGVIGLPNLERFGHGSGDPNIVYVRNVERQLIMEIFHDDGRFADEVLSDSLEHSEPRHHRGRLKFDDE